MNTPILFLLAFGVRPNLPFYITIKPLRFSPKYIAPHVFFFNTKKKKKIQFKIQLLKNIFNSKKKKEIEIIIMDLITKQVVSVNQ